MGARWCAAWRCGAGLRGLRSSRTGSLTGGQPGAGMAAIRVNAALIWVAHGHVAGMRSLRRRCPRTSRALVCRRR